MLPQFPDEWFQGKSSDRFSEVSGMSPAELVDAWDQLNDYRKRLLSVSPFPTETYDKTESLHELFRSQFTGRYCAFVKGGKF